MTKSPPQWAYAQEPHDDDDGAMAAEASPHVVPPDLDAYDAGLLSDYGGGNVEWWQDYIRSELGRAHEFYQSQIQASRHVVPPEWQPIETAPKDGTHILILDRDGKTIEITEWYETTRDVYDYERDGLYRKRTELYYAGWNGNGHRATHWMPLPPAPGIEARSDETRSGSAEGESPKGAQIRQREGRSE